MKRVKQINNEEEDQEQLDRKINRRLEFIDMEKDSRASEISEPGPIFYELLPELWDSIFRFGWFSDFKVLLIVSKWTNALLWRHLKRLDFTDDVSYRFANKIIDCCWQSNLISLLITSYGTLHIDSMPETIVSKLSCAPCLRSLSSLVLQRWSVSPSELRSNHFPKLTHLTIISSNVTEKEYSCIELFSNLKSLTVRFVTEPMLNSITKLTGLQCLNVGNLCEVRTNYETIEYSSKNGREVSDDTFPYLTRMTGLRELHINGLSISDRSLAKLTSLVSLTYLDLTWCQRITDNGLGYLTSLSNLQVLEVWHSGISEAGIQKFLSTKSLPYCKVASSCVRKPYDL